MSVCMGTPANGAKAAAPIEMLGLSPQSDTWLIGSWGRAHTNLPPQSAPTPNGNSIASSVLVGRTGVPSTQTRTDHTNLPSSSHDVDLPFPVCSTDSACVNGGFVAKILGIMNKKTKFRLLYDFYTLSKLGWVH